MLSYLRFARKSVAAILGAVITLGGLLLDAKDYVLMGGLSPQWLSLIGAAVFIFGVMHVLYRHINPAQLAESALQTAPLVTGTENFDAAHFFRHSYTSPFQAEVESNLQRAARHNQPEDIAGFYLRLLAVGTIHFIYDAVWHSIYRSQLLALLELNRSSGIVPVSKFKTYYDQARSSFPEEYAHTTFEQWLQYPIENTLMVRHPSDMIEITLRGKDFLKYLLHWGREADQKRL